jgi:hypothetical protein
MGLEAKNAAQEEFGSARLLRFLETQSNLAATPVLAAFLAELARWSGTADGGTQALSPLADSATRTKLLP